MSENLEKKGRCECIFIVLNVEQQLVMSLSEDAMIGHRSASVLALSWISVFLASLNASQPEEKVHIDNRPFHDLYTE